MQLPKKIDYWIASHAEGIYYILWRYHLVRNEPQGGPPA